MRPLDENNLICLLRRYRPDLEEKEIKGIAHIASGSIGKALAYADGNALDMYEGLQKIVFSGAGFKLSELLDWVDTAVASEESFSLAQELILKFCSDNIVGSRDVEETAKVWENAVKCFRLTGSLNMDKRQVLINVIGQLCKIN